MSHWEVLSTTLPFRKRSSVIPSTMIFFPVAAAPMSDFWCVPAQRQSVQTLSPSAQIATSVGVRSGKAVRIVSTRRFSPAMSSSPMRGSCPRTRGRTPGPGTGPCPSPKASSRMPRLTCLRSTAMTSPFELEIARARGSVRRSRRTASPAVCDTVAWTSAASQRRWTPATGARARPRLPAAHVRAPDPRREPRDAGREPVSSGACRGSSSRPGLVRRRLPLVLRREAPARGGDRAIARARRRWRWSGARSSSIRGAAHVAREGLVRGAAREEVPRLGRAGDRDDRPDDRGRDRGRAGAPLRRG